VNAHKSAVSRTWYCPAAPDGQESQPAVGSRYDHAQIAGIAAARVGYEMLLAIRKT
jgi:hypothetical protein